jgi:hypothetical protein
MMLLAGKSAVVTGSTSGIGPARALSWFLTSLVPELFRSSRTDWGGGGLPLLASGCSDPGSSPAR